MKYNVHSITDAEDDLFEIYKYIAVNDSVNKAKKLLEKLETVCASLNDHPERGRIPPELDRIGIVTDRKADPLVFGMLTPLF